MFFREFIKTADWKKEKHTPAIDVSQPVKKGDVVKVEVSIGKEVPHPNTTEHHIVFMEVYFLPRGSKSLYSLAKVDFSSHGASVEGPNTSGIYTVPSVSVNFKTETSGTIYAVSYCNIHGLWESFCDVEVE